ncbi:MAG: beta-glucosidase [Actinomycetales bacterium]|nr:beta-glucosidase [Actinomycetales bacterium]
MSTPDFSPDLDQLVSELTLEEKVALTTGASAWTSLAVERLGIPSITVTDGPHGVRLAQPSAEFNLAAAEPATCFPTAAALGSAWDLDLMERVGSALGVESRALGVAVLLGPGANIKRHALCGRNFEYFSEDPALSGDLAAAFIRGVQSQGVGTSLKHYAANNQETDRMRVSAQIDELTLREIYLASFERAVKGGQPYTIMCSYNRINGTYAAEDRWLLTEVLRDEWGYDGLVVSDWGAARNRAKSLAAGLDWAMPNAPSTNPDVLEAVRSGALSEADLDTSARRVLQMVARTHAAATTPVEVDEDAHHALAREAAAAGTVLLKNDDADGGPLLPLSADALAGAVVVGEFARSPRYQGAGSSLVNATRLDAALDALREAAGTELPFAAGFSVPGPGGKETGADDEALAAEAVELARGAGTVLLFLGLPAVDESESYDRPRLGLPDNQVALLEAVAAVNPNVVVVLSNGSAVSMPWAHRARAIVEVWLGGQAGGSAIADVLTGAVEPGGRLTETIPLRLEDTPAFGNFPGEAHEVRYAEGLLVGYRWYDARAMAVAFPFGHGLGYTTFSYGEVTAHVRGSGADVEIDVTVTVTNTGTRAGSEVVQVYVADPVATVQRPERELKAFAKVRLEPGASHEVSFTLTGRDLAYWHPVLHRWAVEGGVFEIAVGTSSRDLRGSAVVEVEGENLLLPLSMESSFGEFYHHPVAGPLVKPFLEHSPIPIDDPQLSFFFMESQAQTLATFGIPGFDRDTLAQLVETANAGLPT